MQHKAEVIAATPALQAHLTDLVIDVNAPCPVKSAQYMAISCDLASSEQLNRLVRPLLEDSSCLILCTAEVSITYMNTEAADALIAWTAQFAHVHFVLLEQFLPEGPDHPFARKMLQHFDKLRTPLRSVRRYPLLADQEHRFSSRGWHTAHASSLWSTWQRLCQERPDLHDSVEQTEPFDEWEEFALFASHYFILTASRVSPETTVPNKCLSSDAYSIRPQESLRTQDQVGSKNPIKTQDQIYFETIETTPIQRRFGGALINGKNVEFSLGHGHQRRDQSVDVLLPNAKVIQTSSPIGPRMCHTLDPFATDYILVGGRSSPDCALQDCWRFSGDWRRIEDLPVPLYRHCSCQVQRGLLLFGGRTSKGQVLDNFLLYGPDHGWEQIRVVGERSPKVFGAHLVTLSTNHGLLFGGITERGIFNEKVFSWKISHELTLCEVSGNPHLARIGAQVVPWKHGFLVIGGIGAQIVSPDTEIVFLSSKTFTTQCLPHHFPSRPLLVGHTALEVSGRILILGGGAVCFSFGTFCNEKILSTSNIQRWTPVPRQKLEAFDHILAASKPVCFSGQSLGTCTSWTLESLKERLGSNREIITHQATTHHMDFLMKNFQYCKTHLGEFLTRIEGGSKEYLRSLSVERPTAKPANFDCDWPELRDDFNLPCELQSVLDHLHSSVLRISGPVQMWLHYDVMANVLCQIRGRKRLLLFPPSEVGLFDIPAGKSSSSIDCFDEKLFQDHPGIAKAHGVEVELCPGDILFIPPLWLHTACPLDTVSIAINVFFRSFDPHQYALGRDVYGNRDVTAYEQGRRDVQKIVRSFAELPADAANFYLQRLARELHAAASR